ncbi:glycosyltransferase family 4 protein [Vibrio fluvialis]|uniref:glycosyltransferase family 4 protein n=1 Tax=Vibrio fluvialis TaxID=676 RepID=UPI0028F6D8A1|nr:glycosyltransferase family 4 protein [Vibrio fluvialis]
MKVYIIQPAVPKYRIPFFKKIMNIYPVSVYTTKLDFLGVKTVFKSDKIISSSGFFNFFNLIYWHKNLPLFYPYSKSDIVVINGNPRILNYMLLFVLLRMRGIKSVWWGHGWSAGSYGILSRIRIILMKLASVVLVYTDKEKEKLSISNCYALNNGLDSSEIKVCIQKYTVKRDVGSKFYLVFVGRITKKADFGFLLQSISMVNKNVHLNVIGTSESINFYKSMSDDLGISDRVHWHGPIFDETKIAKIMLSSHAFIYTGSVGLSLIHAFNYGLPAIIHSDEKHHMPEFSAFKNHVNGISFEKGNIVDLCNKINFISTINSEKYTYISNNAFRTVRDSFNIEDMVLRFSSMIENL